MMFHSYILEGICFAAFVAFVARGYIMQFLSFLILVCVFAFLLLLLLLLILLLNDEVEPQRLKMFKPVDLMKQHI
jgi:hypothetical protein